MKYAPLLVALTLMFVYIYLLVRSYINGAISYCLNRNAEKKRRKGQSIKEWFLFSRFRDVIPRIMLVWYFADIIIFLGSIIAVIIMDIMDFGYDKAGAFCLIVFIVWVIPIMVAYFMLRDRNYGTGFNYSRWIVRKNAIRNNLN